MLVAAALAMGPTASTPTAEPILRPGDTGASVLVLQRRLSGLGYWLGRADGRYGPLTVQAVYAVQKAAGLSRDGIAGAATWRAVRAGVLPPASSAPGRRVEVDLRRQLLVLVSAGQVRQVFNTSTGTGRLYVVRGVTKRAVTPRGSFGVYRRVNGWDRGPLGSLYQPAYFHGGVAVHGYGSVPPYPASHGCVRVSVQAMDWLWASDWLKLGRLVVVR